MVKETDLDSLARMVADGFLSLQSQFNSMMEYMDTRFDSLEDRVGTLEAEVRHTNRRIDQVIAPMLDDHARRIKNLEIAGA